MPNSPRRARLTEELKVRMTPEQKAAIRREAARLGLTEANLVRLKLAGKLKLEVMVEKNG